MQTVRRIGSGRLDQIVGLSIFRVPDSRIFYVAITNTKSVDKTSHNAAPRIFCKADVNKEMHGAAYWFPVCGKFA